MDRMTKLEMEAFICTLAAILELPVKTITAHLYQNKVYTWGAFQTCVSALLDKIHQHLES